MASGVSASATSVPSKSRNRAALGGGRGAAAWRENHNRLANQAESVIVGFPEDLAIVSDRTAAGMSEGPPFADDG